MKKLRLTYPLPLLCRVLGVSRSGYYAWINREPSNRTRQEERLSIEIRASHLRSRGTFGPERIQKDLASLGVAAGICLIRKIRKKLNIKCKQTRRFRVTTDSRHDLPVAENLLKQRFGTNAPNRVWVSDITYIPTNEGWLYCAAHKDLFSGEIVGYALAERMTQDLVMDSLRMAAAIKRPPAGLVHHSDRGKQYCSRDYLKLLHGFGMKASMSARGNCYDNAPMESFWGTLKNELVHHRRYVTRQQAVREITEYIEVFYNRQRTQARLGYLSPAAYEQKYYRERTAA
jgi:transposase InsO family protein